MELLCINFIFSAWIFYQAIPDVATDCPCGFGCRGLNTCPLDVCTRFRNIASKQSLCKTDIVEIVLFSLSLNFLICIYIYLHAIYWYVITYSLFSLFHFSNSNYFTKYHYVLFIEVTLSASIQRLQCLNPPIHPEIFFMKLTWKYTAH